MYLKKGKKGKEKEKGKGKRSGYVKYACYKYPETTVARFDDIEVCVNRFAMSFVYE